MWRLTDRLAALTAMTAAGLVALGIAGCRIEDREARRRIQIDGSSTVFPVSQAVAEEFKTKHPDVDVTVGKSGTGGGFKKFCAGEKDINNGSRPISQEEIDACRQNGIDYIELTVAIDGLSVVVNPENDWCDALTVAQLREIWRPGSTIRRWSQLNQDWPDERIKLFGPDTDSGTFDYFTEEVVGESGASRADYTAAVDDNVLVRGVSGDKYALGYFGYAYYDKNKDKLKVVGISPSDDPQDAVEPTPETIEEGTYRPLSRPLFLYVNTASLKRPYVGDFLRFYLGDGQDLVPEVGYVRVGRQTIERERQELEQAIEAVR